MNSNRCRRCFRALFLLVAAAVSACVIWGFFWEPNQLVIRHQPLPLMQWDLPPMKIGVISDLHAGSPFIDKAKIKRITKALNRQKPDIILLVGDYLIDGVLGGTYMPPKQVARLLSDLKAPLGVYAVLGNHEWNDAHEPEAMEEALEAVGITVLFNETRKITFGEGGFWLAGLGDVESGGADIEAVMQPIRSDQRPAILLTHVPDGLATIPGRIALGVAGHTHGGQVSIPFYGPLFTNSEFGQRFAGGLVRDGVRSFFISRGIGTSILPVRFRVKPEINILHIRAKRVNWSEINKE